MNQMIHGKTAGQMTGCRHGMHDRLVPGQHIFRTAIPHEDVCRALITFHRTQSMACIHIIAAEIIKMWVPLSVSDAYDAAV